MITTKQVEFARNPFETSMPPRIDQSAPIEIEVRGTPLQQLAAQAIHSGRSRISDTRGICSFGRSVAAFLPEYQGKAFSGLVRDYSRVLLLGQENLLTPLTSRTRRIGASVSCIMSIVSVEEDVFTSKAIARLDDSRGRINKAYRVLHTDASPDQVRSVQELHMDVGLTPLPGTLLRGYHGPVSTIILEDARGKLLATATSVGLSDVGPDYADTAILLGVSVSPEAQGQGLGSGLTAASLIAARNTLGARRMIGVVHPENTAAFRTNARFGMLPVPGLGAQYVETDRNA